MRICIAGSAICFIPRDGMKVQSTNTTLELLRIQQIKLAGTSVWPRRILLRDRRTGPRTQCWPHSKLPRAITLHKSCCLSCDGHPQNGTEREWKSMASTVGLNQDAAALQKRIEHF